MTKQAQAKPTPGPWVLAEVVEDGPQKTNKRRIRALNEGTEHGAICEVYGARDGTAAAANASLIAAAPELLELLRDLLPVAEIHAEIEMSGRAAEDVLDSVQRGRALIIRIEGAQS